MPVGTVIDVLFAKVVRLTMSLDTLFEDSGSHSGDVKTQNFTSNIFERQEGEFRLLQPIWDLRVGHERIVESPLFPIIFSVSFYFMCMVPFTIIDLFGRNWKWMQKYKIQPDRVVTWHVSTPINSI